MKRGHQIKLKQLFIITGAWMFMGFVIAVYDHLILHTSNSLGPAEEYSFVISAARNVGAGFIGALLGGSVLVFFINVKYREKPYGYTILTVFVVFIFIVGLITIIMGASIVPLRTGRPLTDPVSRDAFKAFVTDSYPVKNGLVWSFIVAFTQLLLQVSSKFGPSTFWNIIKGKYHTPREENRIFMFLDLNSSTAMAEKLGDELYHSLLKDFYSDITDSILENKGTIYQYVGDEVVVAWDFKDGVEESHCIRCFFDLKLAIQAKSDKYLQRYALVPTFKAGIHCGKVVAGEIGIIKRDITYSGDVLNTTSRILNKCTEFKVDIITTSDLLALLNYGKDYISQPLGSIKLRGKEKEVLLNALTPQHLTGLL